MPTGATMGTAGGTAQTTDSKNAQAQPTALVPFVRASGLHRELMTQVTYTQTTADQDIPPIDVPAYGYMRSLLILVSTTAGTGSSSTTTEDGPFNALKNIQLMEPNGSTLYQVSSGYSSYLIHKYGGYRGYNEPELWPNYSYAASSAPAFNFALRIPVEINTRDALGVLPNQNAAATFKLKMTLAKIADTFGGTVSAGPSVTIKVYLEAWDQPDVMTAGQTNQTTPPAMNTTQYWTEQTYTVNAGQFDVRLTRMGNYLRNLLFVLRRASSTRANGDSDWPDPVQVKLDTRVVDNITKAMWQGQVYERYGYTGTADAAGARDNGVYPYDYAHEFMGRVGFENRDLWLPTLSSTRFELSGSWGNAGTLTVLTNDVSTVGNVFL